MKPMLLVKLDMAKQAGRVRFGLGQSGCRLKTGSGQSGLGSGRVGPYFSHELYIYKENNYTNPNITI